MTSMTSQHKSPERALGPTILPSSAGGWALLLFAAALATCAAATVQPADFTARRAAVYVFIAFAAVISSFVATRAGIAWPLIAGLVLAATYRLSYDPVLPDAIVSRLPMRIALLEPTVPMLLALLAVMGWAIWPRAVRSIRASNGRAKYNTSRASASAPATSVSHALSALRHTAQLAIGLGLICYLAFSSIYDLEGGYWFWRLTLAAVLYLGLLWIGIEAAARRMLTPLHAAVLFAGILISVGRSLVVLASGGGG